MSKFTRILEMKVTKSWQLLVYFDLMLPALLFGAALLMGSNVSILFLMYAQYVLNTFPIGVDLIGITGLLFHVALFGWAIWRRNWKDAAIVVVVAGLLALIFWKEWQYAAYHLLRFS